MSKVYVGQDLKLTLTGSQDLTGGSAKIQYKKPGSDTVNEKTAEIETEATAVCWYAFASAVLDPPTAADLDTAGEWLFWLKLTFSDGTIGYGEPYSLTIHNPGS